MNRKSHYALIGATAFASGLVGNMLSAHGQVSLTTTPYSQNFDGILTTVPADNTTQSTPPLPTGWSFVETSTNNTHNNLYRVHNGGSNTGDTYLFGNTGSAERALGGLAGSVTSTWGAQLRNDNTTLSLTSFNIDYIAEQWRDGGTGGFQWSNFQFSTNATSLSSGTWTDFDALDLNTVAFGLPTGTALNGNDPANRAATGPATITPGLAVDPGQSLWIRWIDSNDPSSDHALAVDDFNLSFTTATYVPATVLTWDSDPGTPGAQDGNGTWTNGGNNWHDAATTAQGTWNSAAPDHAIFGAATGGTGTATVSVDAAGVTARTVKFAANSPVYTIAGPGTLTVKIGLTVDNDATLAGAVDVGAANVWSIAAGKSLSVTGLVGGSEIALGGTGTTQFTNAGNSFAHLQVDSGTLEVSNQAALGAGELRINGGTVKILNNVNFTRLVRTGGSPSTINTNGFDGEISGELVGPGGLVKEGLGILTLSNPADVAPFYSGATVINAGTIRVNVQTLNNFSALGGGATTINSGATLHIDNIQVGIPNGGAGTRVFLNGGGTLAGSGTASYHRLGDALTIANGTSGSPLVMDVKTLSATDVFTMGSPVRQRDSLDGTNFGGATDTHATVRVSGPGRVVLAGGYGNNSTDAFAGSWELNDGILQVGPVAPGNTSGEPLNALGYKLGDTNNANTITINGGILAVASDAPNPQDTTPPVPPTPNFLRNPVTLAGGAIASTGLQVDSGGNPTATPVSANFGGALTTAASTTSKILTYDPNAAAEARTVNIVSTGNTTLNGALEIDPGATTGGVVNFARTGGTASVGAGASLNVKAGATANMSGTNILPATSPDSAALTVGGTFNVAGGNNYTIKASSISVPAGGVLAMNDNDFIVDYTGTSPEFTLRDYVKAIYQGGTSGISYTVGAGDTAIAVAERTEWGFSEFNGIPLDPTTIVGKYTYFGDANLDGKVTSDDYVAVDVGLGTGDSWVQGDFNFSGTVTSDDYVAIDVNLGKGSPTPLAFAELKAEMVALHTEMFGDEYVQMLARVEAEGFAALVPEPGALSLVGLGAVGLLGRRRRRA